MSTNTLRSIAGEMIDVHHRLNASRAMTVC